MEEEAHLHVVVRGRVQGVNFRRFVEGHAVQLGLHGMVRNLGDGASVEVHAEGAKEGLLSLLERLRRGPRGASVEGVEVKWGPFQGTYRGFNITTC